MDSVSPNPETETKKQFAEREVPLTVSGRGVGAETGDSFTEETVTKAVFENGAVVRLRAEVNEGQTLRIRNGENGREVEARVAKHVTGEGDVKYVELEFAQAQTDFWATAVMGEAQVKEAPEAPIEIQKPEQAPVAGEATSQGEISSPTTTAGQQEELPAWMKVNKAWEGADSYPIRMQLPKATGETSPRTAEFAADSATITAAQDEYLLPKPSLDFEQFPGLAEERTRLLSGTARRSLSGPIGALVGAALLVIAVGIGTYRLGWLRWPRKKIETKAAGTSVRTAPSSEVITTGQYAVPIPPPKAVSKPLNVVHDVPAVTSDTPTGNENAAATKTAELQSIDSQPSSKPSAKPRSTVKAEAKNVSVQGANADGAYEPPILIKAIRSLSPPEALQSFVSGVVTLDALVDENGKVLSATATSGPKALYEKAAQTVKEGYLYKPAKRDGKPVQAHVDVRIQFWYEP